MIICCLKCGIPLNEPASVWVNWGERLYFCGDCVLKILREWNRVHDPASCDNVYEGSMSLDKGNISISTGNAS